MYFSLISPVEGLEHQAAYARNTDPNDSHRWLWRFMPDSSGKSDGFLYHLRQDKNRGNLFYMLSDERPVSPDSCWQAQSREFAPQFKEGMQLAFELRANPVVTRPRTDGALNPAGKTRGSRHDVVMDMKKRLLQERGLAEWRDWLPGRCGADGQPDPRPTLDQVVQDAAPQWLMRQAERNGFLVDKEEVVASAYTQYRLPRKKEVRDLRFSSVDFSGVLTVTDPAKLLDALHQGLGTSKAFGCGLLLVKPIVS